MARNFVSALKRNSFEVQRLETATAADLVRILGELQDRLRGRIAASASNDRIVDVSVLRQMIAEAQHIIQELERRASGVFSTAQQDAADLADSHIIGEIARLSRAFEKQGIDVKISQYEVLADPPQQLLADHFQSSVNRYGQDLLNAVRRELILSMRTGDTLATTVKRIAGMEGPFGTIGRNNATRLVRTEVSQAYGAAHHKAIVEAKKQVPGLNEVWIHIGSFRCPVCMPLHGSERPIGGTWTINNGLRTRKVVHPPAHPNCACRLSAMRKSWRKDLEAAGYLSQDGPKASPMAL